MIYKIITGFLNRILLGQKMVKWYIKNPYKYREHHKDISQEEQPQGT